MYINNHTAVWGSWYDAASGQWGYACCHSTVHLSYCTGEAGIAAAHASSAQHLLASSSSAPAADLSSAAKPEASTSTNEDSDDRRRKAENLFSKRRLGEGELEIDQSKLADALKAERKRKVRGGEEEYEWGSGKKKKAGDNHEVTEEELGMSKITKKGVEYC